MTVLVVAEVSGSELHPATAHAVSAAAKVGEHIHVLVAGENCEAAANSAAKFSGVDKVLYADSAAFKWPLAENMAPLIADMGKDYSHIFATATTTGKDIMPRAAALLDVSQISDITEVLSGDTFKRPIYAGNAIATVKTSEAIKVITVRQTAFDAAGEGGSGTVEKIDTPAASDKASFVGVEESKSERPELTAANVVVSGGRGMGSPENFAKLEELADKLGAAMGASRAAVDSGWVPNDWQVGQTGKVVAPSLYIAVGISGAIQHLAGMKDSKTIVAINKDENAPIFEVADYGLVASWEEALPQLIEKL